MLPDPLHPALIHFPIVLGILLPIGIGIAFFLIRRGARPRNVWLGVVLLNASLAGSAYLAVETGQDQEERVEQAVPETALETHEEAGETFLYASIVVLVLTGAGLANGVWGKAGRILGTAGALVLLPIGYNVGHSGGELVYRHGAAQVYAQPGAAGGTEGRTGGNAQEKHEEDDDER